MNGKIENDNYLKINFNNANNVGIIFGSISSIFYLITMMIVALIIIIMSLV